jgi:SynChlorMet cassette protein ScmC
MGADYECPFEKTIHNSPSGKRQGIIMTAMAYHLGLKNGQQWILEADPDLEDWLQRFASILMIHETVSQQNIPLWRFCIKKKGVRDYAGDSWISSKSPWLSIYSKTDGTDLITEIAPYSRDDPNEDIIRMMLAIQSLYLAVWPCGGIPVHAAMLEKKGQAILIAAPGGTGKSTCATRIPPPWSAPCDDSVLLIPWNGAYYAHPLPTWSDHLIRNHRDRKWDIGHAVPVTGLWFLEQGEVDGGTPVGKGEAASRLYQSAVQISGPCIRKQGNEELYADWHTALFNRCCDAVSHLSCGILRVTLTGKFWEYL